MAKEQVLDFKPARRLEQVTPNIASECHMNSKFMGRLGLSDAEEDALVAFMQTLTDGFMPP